MCQCYIYNDVRDCVVLSCYVCGVNMIRLHLIFIVLKMVVVDMLLCSVCVVQC